MKLALAAVFGLLLANTSPAHACSGANPDQKEMTEYASFIGMVKVLNIDLSNHDKSTSDSNPMSGIKEITFEVIQPYKDELHQKTIKAFYNSTSCRLDFVKVGQVYEEAFFKFGKKDMGLEGLYVSDQRNILWKNTLLTLRSTSKKSPQQLYLETNCQKAGGVWGQQDNARIFSCNIPASNSGEKCSDSIQCEGICIADLNDESEKEMMKQDIMDEINNIPKKTIKKNGTCSKWVTMHGSFYIPKFGRVSALPDYLP